MGIRRWKTRPWWGPGAGAAGADGVDEWGDPVDDPYGGPTTSDVVDGIRGIFDRPQERSPSDIDTDTNPQVRGREVDCSEMADETACNECALKQGFIGPPKMPRFVSQTNIVNYDYQLYVSNLKSAPLRFGYMVADKADPDRRFFSVDTIFDYLNRRGFSRTVMEWHFNGCEFDGFWPNDCQVVETKGNFQHFLDENGDPRWDFVLPKVFGKWEQQMRRQKNAVQIAEPEGTLHWYFMQEATKQAAINLAGLDASLCTTLPMPGQPS